MWQIIGYVENDKGIVGELQEYFCEENGKSLHKIVIPIDELLVKRIEEDCIIQSNDDVWKIKK